MVVRIGGAADVGDMAQMAEARRVEYEAYQPVMWKRAPNALELSKQFFAFLLTDRATTVLVSEGGRGLDGFLIARVTPHPPVFAPGGATILIDDFCVREPGLWESVGRALLDAVAGHRKSDWRQMVVICGEKDLPKKKMLCEAGLSTASNWLTKPFPPHA